MRLPVRLNSAGWPRTLLRFLNRNGAADPRVLLSDDLTPEAFTETVCELYLNGTFKTTKSQRFPETLRTLSSMRLPESAVILDLGASDGSTSLGIMDALPRFGRYYVTDRYIEIAVETRNDTAVFIDDHGRPAMYANRYFVVYNHPEGTWPLLRPIISTVFRSHDRALKGARERRTISLLNPDLRKKLGASVGACAHNIFEPWPLEKVDLVIAANILNRSYFSDVRIAHAVGNIRDALNEGGVLVVVHNRPQEQATIFRMHGGRFVAESDIGGGCEIRPLVLAS